MQEERARKPVTEAYGGSNPTMPGKVALRPRPCVSLIALVVQIRVACAARLAQQLRGTVPLG